MNLLFIFLLALFAGKNTASPPDNIEGTWLTAGDDAAKVSIYRTGNKYYGKIIWLEIPTENGKARVDEHNPDASKRNDPAIGMLIVKDFVWNEEEKHFDSGTVYDPKSGSTYSGYMELVDENKLKLRGFIVVSWIGRTEYWTRVK